MGLTVEGVGQKENIYTNSGMIRPEVSDDMELSSLLSGSGSFKTNTNDAVGKLLAENNDKKETNKQTAEDIALDCIPSVLSSIVGYKFTGSKVMLITCLVANLANIALKCIKNKRAVAAA